MNEEKTVLHILLIEDDQESIKLLIETLPKCLAGYDLEWEECTDFEVAVRRVSTRRYDLVVTDIYRDRNDREKRDPEDDQATDIVGRLKRARFCPVVAFTDGSFPHSLTEGPFVKLADKSKGNEDIVKKVEELLATGIPGIARRLHDELDLAGASYVWSFLEQHWDSLEEKLVNGSGLERLVRRRAAVQLGRLAADIEGLSEVKNIEGVEYYVYPPIASGYRLGQILRSKDSGEYCVINTPHCYLTIQTDANSPRADHVAVVKTVEAGPIWEEHAPQSMKEETRLKAMAGLVQSPARNNQIRPEGRYWFLPSFLDMPDLYCDFLQLASIPYGMLNERYERFAVLDAPFAEALQSCFTAFYSAVGLPSLNVEPYRERARKPDNGD